MTPQEPHPQRCLIIASCHDCPNRMEMYHLYKPYGMMVLPDGMELFDYRDRWVCTETDDDKEILSDLPEWCPLPAPYTPAQQAQQDGGL